MTKAGDEVASWAQRIHEERATGARLVFPKASTLAQGFGELDAAAQRDLIRELLVDDDSSAAFDRKRAVLQALAATRDTPELEAAAADVWRETLADSKASLITTQVWVMLAAIAGRGQDAARIWDRFTMFTSKPGLQKKLAALLEEIEVDDELLDLMLAALAHGSPAADPIRFAGLTMLAAHAERADIVTAALALVDSRRDIAGTIIRDLLHEFGPTDAIRALAETPAG